MLVVLSLAVLRRSLVRDSGNQGVEPRWQMGYMMRQRLIRRSASKAREVSLMTGNDQMLPPLEAVVSKGA